MFKRFLFLSISFLTLVFPFSAFSRPLPPGTDGIEGFPTYSRDRMNEYDKILLWLPKLSKYCVPLIYFHSTAFNTTAFSINDNSDFIKWHSFYGHLDGGLLIYYDFSNKYWVAVINPEDYYKQGHITLEKSGNYFTGSTSLEAFNKFASWGVAVQNDIYSTRQKSYNQNNPSFPISLRHINSIGDFYILNTHVLLSQIKLHIHNYSNLPYPLNQGTTKVNFKCPVAP